MQNGAPAIELQGPLSSTSAETLAHELAALTAGLSGRALAKLSLKIQVCQCKCQCVVLRVLSTSAVGVNVVPVVLAGVINGKDTGK